MHPVSAYMLVLDEGPFIHHAIGSLLPHVDELLIMDCGSTDETLGVIAEMALCDSRIRLLTEPQRASRYAALWDEPGRRNACLGMLKHDWVLTMDGDEYLTADYGVFKMATGPARLDTVNLLPGRKHIVSEGEGESFRRFSPDPHVRFFNRRRHHYDSKPLHCHIIDEAGQVVEGTAIGATNWHYHAFYKIRGLLVQKYPERYVLADLEATPPLAL